MRYKELLETESITEYSQTVQVGIENVQVLVNPTKQALRQYMDKLKYKQMRGYYDDGKFYFWDSSKLVHGTAADKLGLEYNYKNCFYMNQKGNSIYIDMAYKMFDIFSKHPWAKNNFTLDDYDFYHLNEAQLDEYKIIDMADYQVIERPNKMQLMNLMKKSDNMVRGLYHNGTYYFWRAHSATHHQVFMDMDFDGWKESNTMMAYTRSVPLGENGLYISAVVLGVANDKITNDPYIRRLFVPVTDHYGHEWLTWVAQKDK